MAESSEQLVYKGRLAGHNDWVTQVVTAPSKPDLLVSASRDKTLLLWKLNLEHDDVGGVGTARMALHGHGHFVSDVVLANEGDYALSGSWDHTMRLWDLKTGKVSRRFCKDGHTKDVLSVAFSPDNRQIVSSGRDKTIKLWNTLAECKYTISQGRDSSSSAAHDDWVSCVRFSPSGNDKPQIISSGWDGKVKVWNLSNCRITDTLHGHNGYLNAVTISPDGSLCASGGKDGRGMLWDLNSEGENKKKHLYTLEDPQGVINAMCFSPNRYWLCAAVEHSVKIWNLETKEVVQVLQVSSTDGDAQGTKSRRQAQCTSLAWSADGNTLYAGYTDGYIRVWTISNGGYGQAVEDFYGE